LRRLEKLSRNDPTCGPDIAWLAEQRIAYRKARGAGDPIGAFLTKYRDPRVKRAILRETLEKCAYCETKYLPVDWGDVEHIWPKAADPERLLDYDNLTLACGKCNGGKSDKEYNDGAPLLNPYVDDIDRYLFAAGPMVLPNLDDTAYVRGDRTITDTKLNRKELMERRAEYIRDKYQALLRAYRTAANDALRNHARAQIAAMQAHDAEYTLIARWFFNDKVGK
jgi:5-methylcytosine-specific restriction endonuclease McrA